MTEQSRLPARFVQLEYLAQQWALPTEKQRSAKRWSASADEFQELYDAMVPLISEILAYLDQFSLDEMPEDALALFHLSLALAESAPHVEFYKGAAKVPHSFDARRMLATRGDAPDPNHDMSPEQLATFKPQAP